MITKPKTVPELRFPGFEGEWETEQLGEIADIKLGKMLDKEKQTTGCLLPYLNNISLRWNEVDTSNLPQMYFRDTELDKFGLRAGDVVVCEGGEPGRAALWDGRLPDLKFQKAIHRVRFNVPFEPCLLVFYLEKIAGTTKFEMLFTGGGIKHLTRETFSLLQIPMISLPEQRKIADFLTAVDGRIGQLSQKKALLEDYKKGVMQQLFTQALRFKDDHGNDFPEWEEKKYSEVYTFQNTNSYSRDLLTYDGGEVRNIHYGDIHTKFRSNFYLSKENVPFIKPEVELKRITKDCYCRVGDLVIADASEDYADVGKCIEIMELGEKTLAGLHTFIARPRKGAISPGFGGYLMQSREVRLKIMTIAQGTKVLGLSKNMLCNIKLPFPHPDEQTKIANFLTALDRKIESVSSQITHTQTFKKGLLQQMFV